MMLHPDVALQKDFWKYSLPVLGNELGRSTLWVAARP